MKSARLFLDTAFVQALLNNKDDYHATAKALLPKLRAATLQTPSSGVIHNRNRNSENCGCDYG